MQTPTHSSHYSHSSPPAEAPLPGFFPSSHPVIHQSIPPAPPSIHPLIQPSTTPVPLSALAELLGATRSTIRHFADRLGFRFFPQRLGARREARACLTADQAAAITAAHQADLLAHPPVPKPEPLVLNRDLGIFYLIQLEPELDPGRFKLGFTTDLEGRLQDFLTVAPLARLIATWPALRSWEHTAIAATAQGATPMSHEVFRSPNLEQALAQATRFFAALPEPSAHPHPHPQTPPAHSQTAHPTPIPNATPTPPTQQPRLPACAPPISPITPIRPISPSTAPPCEPTASPPAPPAAPPPWSACASAPLWSRRPDG